MADVYQDFLPPQHFADVRQLLMTNMLPWYYTDRVVSME